MVNIKLIFQNVNSIVFLYKRHELNTLLNKHRPDIMLIAEHRLSKKHYTNLDNYQFVRQNERATHTEQAQRPNPDNCGHLHKKWHEIRDHPVSSIKIY